MSETMFCPCLAMRALFVIISGLLLSACGGGTPAPPLGPPPPPPPEPINETLIDLVVDETFKAASIILSFDVDAAGVTSNVMSRPIGFSDAASSPNTVAYDVSADTFTLSVIHNEFNYTQTFGPGDIDNLGSDSTFRVYRVDNGGGDVTELALLIPGDPVYGLSYVTLGVWNSVTADPDVELSFGSTFFGILSKPNQVPRAGAATYTGLTLGHLDMDDTLFSLTGDVQVDVDFVTRDVTGTFTNMIRENTVTGDLSAWRDFSATASIPSVNNPLFIGTTTTPDSLLSGQFNGGFFGPGAAEIGGWWNLRGAGETAVGGFVAGQ